MSPGSGRGTWLDESDRFLLDGSDAIADVDVEKLANERARNITWSTSDLPPAHAIVDVSSELASLPGLRRFYERDSFVPDDPETVHERAREILAIQSTALARRALAVGFVLEPLQSGFEAVSQAR